MGRYEVLEYLELLRKTGDVRFRRYQEIHRELRERGVCLSYPSVWRSVNSLWWDKEIEVDFDVDGLQRTAKFRAHHPSGVQVAQVQRLHNIREEADEKSRSDTKGERFVAEARRS